MKKLIFFLCVVALAACGGGKAGIEGKWQLAGVSGENLSESEKTATIEFTSDGNFDMQEGGESKRKGTWKLSEDGKTLNVEADGQKKEWTNVEVGDDKLSFNEGDDKVSFTRAK